jgi:hypothetical protein
MKEILFRKIVTGCVCVCKERILIGSNILEAFCWGNKLATYKQLFLNNIWKQEQKLNQKYEAAYFLTEIFKLKSWFSGILRRVVWWL